MPRRYGLALVAGCLFLTFSGAQAEPPPGSDGAVSVVGRWAEGYCWGATVRQGIAYVANGGYLDIVDVSNPTSLRLLGRVLTPADVRDVALGGSFAYIVSSSGLLSVADVSDAAHPVLRGSVRTLNRAYAVAVSGATVFVANYFIEAVDVSDPDNPVVVGFLDAREAYDVKLSGGNAYVAAGPNGLRVVDVSDPADMQLLGIFDTDDSHFRVYGVSLLGAYAYVAAGDEGMWVVDITDPANPFEVGSLDVGARARDVAVSGSHVLVAELSMGGQPSGLRAVDVADPANPSDAGFFTTEDPCEVVAVGGSRAYIPIGGTSLRVIDVANPSSMTEVGRYETPSAMEQVAVSNGFLYGASQGQGLRILDVSDPANVVQVALHDTPGSVRDVAVNGDHAYVSDYYGMRVLDVTDPSQPYQVGYFEVADPADQGQIDRTTRIRVRGRHVYLARYFRFSVIDVANPANPVEVGSADGGYWPTALAVDGNHAYLGDDFGLVVVDITNPTAPVTVGTSYDPGDPASSPIRSGLDVAASGDHAYLATWQDGMRIMDVSVPSQPTEMASVLESARTSGVALSGTQLNVAASLHVFDVSDPSAPEEIGTFETPSETTCVTTDGDLIYLVDGATGLWILRYDTVPPDLLVSPTSLDFGSSHDRLELTIANGGGGTLTWSVSESPDVGWLTSIEPASGNGNATVTVRVDRGQLAGEGDRTSLDISSNGGSAEVEVLIGQVCSLTCSATVPATGVEGQPVSFSGSATASACPTGPAYRWDFGDSSSPSTVEDPTHVYASPGTYTWTMTVTAGVASCTRSGTIRVGEQCTVGCTATGPPTALAGVPASFSGSATANGCSAQPVFDWDFGDGSAHATLQSPTHTYTAAGTYTWSLTVTVDGASCSRSGSVVVQAGTRSYLVPAVAHNAGLGGSQWRTDIVLVNPTGVLAVVELVFHAGSSEHRVTVSVPPNGTREWRNVVEVVFGLDSGAEIQGTLEILSEAPLLATARTYNQGESGTFGQYLPAVESPGALLAGGMTGVLPQLNKRSSSYRSNLGVLNLGDSVCEVRVRLFAADGSQAGSEGSIWVPARRWLQRSDILGFVGAGDHDLVYALVEVVTPGCSVWVYGSVVDNTTGDPTTIPVVLE